MHRYSAFSLCELLVALGLVATFFGLVAEALLVIRNARLACGTATRDLLRVPYFVEVILPEILWKKKGEQGIEPELFFALDTKRTQEISKQRFDLGENSGTTLIQVTTVTMANKATDGRQYKIVPVRLRLESPSHLHREKRRAYELHAMVPLF